MVLPYERSQVPADTKVWPHDENTGTIKDIR